MNLSMNAAVSEAPERPRVVEHIGDVEIHLRLLQLLQVRKHCDFTCGVTVRYHDDIVADALKLEVDGHLADA